MSIDKLAIGIDIGGTKMAVGLVRHDGSILDRLVLPTEAEQGFERAVRRLGDTIDHLLQQAGASALQGIGIGCAGPVDPSRGLINNPFTLSGWNQCDIVRPLQERFRVPVRLENDADAATVGEVACGSGRGFDPVVLLTFGTGIGGGVVRGGGVYRGAAGEHPELGHVLVADDGPECYCGTRGCLESIASGTALGLAGQGAGLPDARAVFAAAASGNSAAEQIVTRAVHATAAAAWTLWHTLLPERLILGGGMMQQHYELFVPAIRQRLERVTQFTRESVSLAPAILGNDAGMVGAAMLVHDHSSSGGG